MTYKPSDLNSDGFFIYRLAGCRIHWRMNKDMGKLRRSFSSFPMKVIIQCLVQWIAFKFVFIFEFASIRYNSRSFAT
jgi:hypothetical protein